MIPDQTDTISGPEPSGPERSGRERLLDAAAFAPRTAIGAARAIERVTFDAVGSVVGGAVEAGVRRSGAAADAMATRAEPILADILRRVVEVMPIEALIARIDVNAIVSQVDVDALVQRVDVESLVSRIDLPRIVGEVMAEIQLGDIISDSTAGVASDVRDSLRVQAIRVDGGVASVIDKMLLRRRPRDVAVPGLTPGFG